MTSVTTDTSPASLLELWVDRIGAEYREDPGLSLTPAQAARFWNLTPEFCRSVIDHLTACGRLRMTTTGCLVATGDRMKTVFTMTASRVAPCACAFTPGPRGATPVSRLSAVAADGSPEPAH